MPHQKAVQPARVYQLNVSLRHSKPPIWRRVLVPEEFNLAQLHGVLQCVISWEDYHLHEFTINGRRYGVPNEEDVLLERPVQDERKMPLCRVLPRMGHSFLYLYDFGDGWRHDLLVEAIVPADPSVRYPVCVAGKRRGPPEDCGGMGGYERFLEAIRNPLHKEHRAMLDWIGDPFDPERFSLEEINVSLKRSFPKRRERTPS